MIGILGGIVLFSGGSMVATAFNWPGGPVCVAPGADMSSCSDDIAIAPNGGQGDGTLVGYGGSGATGDVAVAGKSGCGCAGYVGVGGSYATGSIAADGESARGGLIAVGGSGDTSAQELAVSQSGQASACGGLEPVALTVTGPKPTTCSGVVPVPGGVHEQNLSAG